MDSEGNWKSCATLVKDWTLSGRLLLVRIKCKQCSVRFRSMRREGLRPRIWTFIFQRQMISSWSIEDTNWSIRMNRRKCGECSKKLALWMLSLSYRKRTPSRQAPCLSQASIVTPQMSNWKSSKRQVRKSWSYQTSNRSMIHTIKALKSRPSFNHCSPQLRKNRARWSPMRTRLLTKAKIIKRSIWRKVSGEPLNWIKI